nr:aldose epimerase family protein [uncultured Draconibacterium sp.]
MKKWWFLAALFFMCLSSVCLAGKVKQNEKEMKVTIKSFGTSQNGEEVNCFTLTNNKGIQVGIIEFGAIVKSLKTPDKNGVLKDIVLGYDDLAGYENDSYYFGATIGRVANRIGGASVKIEGKNYDLAKNTLPNFGPNHLHGGVKSFNKVVWKGEAFESENEIGVTLSYLSKDGEEGYPGNLQCTLTYSLNDKNELKIDYSATTDKKTVVNFTHHSYFNLRGDGKGDVLDQHISINADYFTPADDDLIPTGEVKKVDGLPVDFKKQRSIGSRFNEMQLAKFKGYDLNYIINHKERGDLALAATAFDPQSGIILEVLTTQPCMHFYTGNFLDGVPGKEGKRYEQNGAFCFEPQGYPDAPNKLHFQSVNLAPDEEYSQTIIYKFSR